MGIKNAEFDADFEFVEKVAQNLCVKVINGKVREKWSFSTFSTVCKSFPPKNFLCDIFSFFFQRI
jgi:hypothetical protein